MTDIQPDPKLNDLVQTHTVGNVDYASKLDEHLFINRSDLDSEFSEQSARFAYYATCYELAADKSRRADVNLKRMYAVLDYQKRQEMMNGAMKSTEKMIENMVITDDSYVAAQDESLDAEHQMGLLKAARDSMNARKEMLVSLGANHRAEFRSDITLMNTELRNRT